MMDRITHWTFETIPEKAAVWRPIDTDKFERQAIKAILDNLLAMA